MTPKEIIEVVQAFEDGKEIEYYICGNSVWHTTEDPTWNFKECKYRVKQLKKVLEKRWKMLKDYNAYTSETTNYYNQNQIAAYYTDWYKGQMIEVEIDEK